MSNVGTWVAQANVEPVSTATIGGIANIANYAIVSGCAPTYSAANLNVTVASGAILYGGVYTAVAGASVTLVADPTNPRWSWVGINSSGTPTLVSGTAAATPSVPDVGNMVPVTLVYVQAGLTIADNATYKLDKRVMSPSALPVGWVAAKYKSSAQTATATTTFATVTAADGNFAFDIGAGEVWRAVYRLPLTITSAGASRGGFKFQFTGPSAPTEVLVQTMATGISTTFDGGANTYTNAYVLPASPTASAFSAAFANNLGSNTSANGQWFSGVSTGFIDIYLFVRNGANAGTVTLQFAQSGATDTSTIGSGATMLAERMA